VTPDPSFHVRLEVFEGPLDLLLALVGREALDITTVALAQVTDQYLAALTTLEEIDPGAMAAFCEVAATLILLKSRALLPRARVEAADEEADADELALRLRAYRRFRRAAERLGQREHAGLRAYVRLAPPPDLPPRLDPGDVAAADLARAFQAALAAVEPAEVAAEPPAGVKPHPVRLQDRLADIRALLASRGRIRFGEAILGERRDREFVVVSFLAVLELLRRRAVRAVQDELFGEIVLEARPEADGPAWVEPEEATFVDAP